MSGLAGLTPDEVASLSKTEFTVLLRSRFNNLLPTLRAVGEFKKFVADLRAAGVISDDDFEHLISSRSYGAAVSTLLDVVVLQVYQNHELIKVLEGVMNKQRWKEEMVKNSELLARERLRKLIKNSRYITSSQSSRSFKELHKQVVNELEACKKDLEAKDIQINALQRKNDELVHEKACMEKESGQKAFEEENRRLREEVSMLQGSVSKLQSAVETLSSMLREQIDESAASKADIQKKLDKFQDIMESLDTTVGQCGTSQAKRTSELKESEDVVLSTIMEGKPNSKWEDIQGLEGAKETLKHLKRHIIRPDLFPDHCGGVLLFGPPGNGKTLLARATAAEFECTFFNVTCSSINSMWFGRSEKIVKSLFVQAREKAPSIIFIDEIDGIGGRRGNQKQHEASRRTLNEILTNMEGIESEPDHNSKFVLVMGATNRPQDLDDAFLRRFKKQIHIPMPNENTRRALLETKLELPPDIGVSFDDILKHTEGHTCDEIVIFCRDATNKGKHRVLDDYPDSDIATLPFDFSNTLTKEDLMETPMYKNVSPENVQEYVDWCTKKGIPLNSGNPPKVASSSSANSFVC